MKINNLYGPNPPKKPEKQSSAEDVRARKAGKNDVKSSTALAKSDQVEISQEAQELQKTDDEISLSKELLSKTPQSRPDVIHGALAKLKAGLYSSEEIVEETARKLLQSGELGDILK